MNPQLKDRLLLYPMGVGDKPIDKMPLFANPHNAGHTMLGAAIDAPAMVGSIQVIRLDDVFQQPYPNIRLLKLDVEGFETKVLKGARQLFTSGAVQAIFMEVSKYLRSQGSSSAELISLLLEYHFVFIYENGKPMSEHDLHDVACHPKQFMDILAIFDKTTQAREISCMPV